jgi:hypothetical protein
MQTSLLDSGSPNIRFDTDEGLLQGTKCDISAKTDLKSQDRTCLNSGNTPWETLLHRQDPLD